MQATPVKPHQHFRWAGDEIVHDPIVPAARSVPVARGKRGYAVDIREFLGIRGSALIRKQVSELRKSLSDDERLLFDSRVAGAFDFRARAVVDFMGRELAYVPGSRRADNWLVPSETLAARGGDCEDLAFVLASMLEQSGISSYCIRVAFGRVTRSGGGEREKSWDHAWVVYMNEGGAWEILEPLAAIGNARKKPRRAARKREGITTESYEYAPHFVMNRHHLWRVRTSQDAAARPLTDYLGERRFFDEFDPTFATSVHNSIYRGALDGISTGELAHVERSSLIVDANTLAYDPRDHFDFAYIDQGWARVARRLKTGNIGDFALALHAIADFYAHSTYADFGVRRPRTDALVPYDPTTKRLARTPTYDFSAYTPIPGTTKSAADAVRPWQGKIISGQWWRWYTTYPADLKGKAELALRRTLPDHDAISVDGSSRESGHKRYDEAEFQFQFADRRAAAVEHIRSVWHGWRRQFPR